jgi:hypothetical protein
MDLMMMMKTLLHQKIIKQHYEKEYMYVDRVDMVNV